MRAKLAGVFEQGVACVISLADQPQGFDRGACKHGGRRGRIDEAPGSVADERDDLFAGCNERTGHTERFAQSANDDVGLNAELGREAATLWPKHPESVCLVDHQPRIEGTSQFRDLAQGRNHPIHREEGVRDDEGAACSRPVFSQERPEVIDVAVCVHVNACSREAAAVDETGVIQRIAEDYVAGPGQGLNGSDVRGVARREEHGRRRAQEVGVGDFGVSMGIHRSTDEPGSGGAHSFALRGG